MKSLLRLLLKTHHQRNRSGSAQTEKGMTLVELLVGSIMAFLIITPMLAFVVDMLNTDRREQVKSNTEQDIQAAVDFIAQDLSQAIYIYDNRALNGLPGPNEQKVRPQLPQDPNGGVPILVFWKRQQLKNSLPINPTVAAQVKPINCGQISDKCNDTYVLSLVAYYQVTSNNSSTWCQPAGGPCPSRIVRYEIRDGIDRVIDPSVPGGVTPYGAKTTPAQQTDPAFNTSTATSFNLNNPTVNVTNPAGFSSPQSGAQNPQVLVNYIDNSTANVPVPTGGECQTILGFVPPAVTPAGTPAFDPNHLLITNDPTHSFYACVDTSKNIARVTIRGNSLRRLETPANYDPNKAAYFPTASVQVQGLSARGK
ncbi:hormogonium polysaccharide secretion pseudopilin HpsC [Microcoleus sp.]|uniref:hormogonium polysaccharide secretion pseudopilin HpsC n=1 Tax=Microcoleus sp. TaxID=44472 RepID=UPI00403E7EBA